MAGGAAKAVAAAERDSQSARAGAEDGQAVDLVGSLADAHHEADNCRIGANKLLLLFLGMIRGTGSVGGG